MSKNRSNSMGRHTLLFFLLLAVTLTLASCQGEKLDAASLRGGETRDTLSPYYFNGSIAAAYSIAKEIPEVLDALYCYCDCKKHMGHKSLLTCYVDTHAVRCDICLDEAYMAYEMHNHGKDTVEIRKAVDKKFSRIRDQRKSGGSL